MSYTDFKYRCNYFKSNKFVGYLSSRFTMKNTNFTILSFSEDEIKAVIESAYKEPQQIWQFTPRDKKRQFSNN